MNVIQLQPKVQCPSCGVEREYRMRVYRWNYVNAEAGEEAIVVRTYECAMCGTAVRIHDTVLPKNGKTHATTQPNTSKADTSHA